MEELIDTSFLALSAGRPLPNVASCDYLLCKGAKAAMCQCSQVPPAGRGAFDVNSKTRLTDITDGTSNTFAVGERAGNNPPYGVRQVCPDTTPPPAQFPGQQPLIDQGWSPARGRAPATH